MVQMMSRGMLYAFVSSKLLHHRIIKTASICYLQIHVYNNLLLKIKKRLFQVHGLVTSHFA